MHFHSYCLLSRAAPLCPPSDLIHPALLVSYLGDGAALDEGGLVRRLGGWNEWRRRGNVGRSTGSAERHTDSIWHTLDQLIGGRVEDWWEYKKKQKLKRNKP